MADGRNRQALMGNDTPCMTGIVDQSRSWQEERLLLSPLSPAEGGHGTAPAAHLQVTALPCKNGCESSQEPWKTHGITAGLDGPVWGWLRSSLGTGAAEGRICCMWVVSVEEDES